MFADVETDAYVLVDGDDTYDAASAPGLIACLLDQQLDMVNATRVTEAKGAYRPGQRLGNVMLSGTDAPDAVRGFRAYSREAASYLNVVSPFSYTIETLIQPGSHQLTVASVPVETKRATRDSRLFRSIPHFLLHSLATMVRIYTMYHPLRMFSYIGISLGIAGAIPILRFVYLYLSGDGGGQVQSLVLGGVLVLMGFVSVLFALVADLIGFNRRLIEECLHKVRTHPHPARRASPS